jgi:hypothetical protein
MMSKEYTAFNGDAFWNDGYVQELDMAETAVYFHYITSPRLENSGVFKEGRRMAAFYVKADVETVKKAEEKLEKDGKIFRIGEWVMVPSSLKHQKFDKSPNVLRGIYTQLKTVPVEVLKKLHECGYFSDLSPFPNPSGTLPLDSDQDIYISGGISSTDHSDPAETTECEQPVDNPHPTPRPPPPTLYKIIKEKAKACGFYLDDFIVRKIEKSIPDSTWFTDERGVIDFTAQKIADIYSGKPKAELKRLFISALTSWKDIRDEYPDWLNAKCRDDELRDLERLKNTPPKACPRCGAAMDRRKCPSCNGWVYFNEESAAWEYQERVDFSFADFLKRRAAESPPAENPPETQDDERPDF